MNPTIAQVVIDCDPGADDFFALLWALGLHKKGVINILAITTVGGNVGADITYLNALRACAFMEVTDIPVGRSEQGKNKTNAAHIHGSDGLGEASIHLPRVKIPRNPLFSSELLKKIIEEVPEVQILTLGPLTNVAKYLGSLGKNKRSLKPSRVISMGGALYVSGNVTPVGEFNIFFDPESADYVFTHSEHTILIPLDVTSKLIFTRHEMQTILSTLTGKRAKFLEALTLHTFKTNMAFRETAGTEGFLVHDASVIAMLIYPHLFRGQFLPLRVETKGELTRGETVTDIRNIAHASTHTFVATDVDRDRFMEAMVQDFLSFL